MNKVFGRLGVPYVLLPRFDHQHHMLSIEQASNIHHLVDRVLDTGVPGAFVELGCYTGSSAALISGLLEPPGAQREFHVYDRFDIELQRWTGVIQIPVYGWPAMPFSWTNRSRSSFYMVALAPMHLSANDDLGKCGGSPIHLPRAGAWGGWIAAWPGVCPPLSPVWLPRGEAISVLNHWDIDYLVTVSGSSPSSEKSKLMILSRLPRVAAVRGICAETRG
ncbi:MAG: hypothetical protein IPO60_18215 [Flavobacteriales bacterium]|nr:hypothetical protein [Flavobacteriales bacterium]